MTKPDTPQNDQQAADALGQSGAPTTLAKNVERTIKTGLCNGVHCKCLASSCPKYHPYDHICCMSTLNGVDTPTDESQEVTEADFGSPSHSQGDDTRPENIKHDPKLLQIAYKLTEASEKVKKDGDSYAHMPDWYNALADLAALIERCCREAQHSILQHCWNEGYDPMFKTIDEKAVAREVASWIETLKEGTL